MDDIKVALKEGDKKRLGVLRLIAAAIKQKEVDDQTELDEQACFAVLEKMAKQRKESIEQYQKAGRDDLQAQEEFELELIDTYLPQAMSEADMQSLVDAALQESGATSVKDMGKVMSVVKAKATEAAAAQGRADMGQLSKLIKQKLAASEG